MKFLPLILSSYILTISVKLPVNAKDVPVVRSKVFSSDVPIEETTIPPSGSKNFSIRALPTTPTFPDSGNLPQENTTQGSLSEAVKFMRKFGYIPTGDDTADFIFSAETLKEKLKIVQKFGAIPQTGEMDEATFKLMASPRCGVHDVIDPEEGKRRKKRFIIGSSGWNKRKLTYHIANWSPKLRSKEMVKKELRRAFDHWSKYGRLQIDEVETNDADIIIFFAEYSHYDNYPFDGQGGILAHAYYPYDFEHYGGDIHFDESEDWKLTPDDDDSGLDFFTVAVHEIGHSLGLAHSPVPSSIMFPYYKGVARNFALDYDDVMGMWELYIKRKLEGDDETTTTTTTTTTTPRPSMTSTASYGVQSDEGEDGVRYHGDYETVDEHEERNKGTEDLPDLPPLFPDYADDGYYEKEKRRREEEERRRREREEQERRWWEEERRRNEEEEMRRREEEKRRRKEEEEEIIRREEEERRWREEEERRRSEWGNKTTTLSPDNDVIPDLCEGNFDSVALLRGEIFIFKGKHLWRYQRKGFLLPGYPATIRDMFSYLPIWVQKVDAAYERRNDSMIVFFVGKYFLVHDGNKLVEGSPRPITDYGLPESITEINAIFHWLKNNRTYLFSRNLYWRRSDEEDRMDENYPREMEKWGGLPHTLDAAVTDAGGVSFFFKDHWVFQYDNKYIRPTSNSPAADLRRWTGC